MWPAAALSAGYWHRPDLTAERFVERCGPDGAAVEHTGPDGAAVERTGDEVAVESLVSNR